MPPIIILMNWHWKYFHFNTRIMSFTKCYVNSIGVDPSTIDSIEKIPFLPISFFKTHTVTTTTFEPEIIFESSGTTGDNTSRHYIKNAALYQRSFLKAFNLFFGNPSEWCILALLPGYLERNNSSLVYMVNELIKKSRDSGSGFYLKIIINFTRRWCEMKLLKSPHC